jgi:acyl-CoA reductase-like NAD-dependent aldehyde dehydrogenase
MKIVKEEIFGPVGVVIKFKDEAGGYFPSPLVF